MRWISPKFVKKHKQCLAARNTSVAPDPYTPNWAPYFSLFLRMKSQLYGHRLQDMDKIRGNHLHTIPKCQLQQFVSKGRNAGPLAKTVKGTLLL
jgi:hypothetical protein